MHDLRYALPRVLRARDFRLYTEGGRRLVDLWQDGGAAVLGHTPPHVLTALKDTASRGIFAPFPHPNLRRLEQALSQWFPGRTVRTFPDGESADAALTAAGFPLLRDFADPGIMDPGPAYSALRWRPWSSLAAPNPGAVIAPVLPFPGPGAPVALLPPAGGEAAFPPSQPVSPVACAVAARAVRDLLAALPSRSYASLRRTEAALRTSAWTRRGIYLHRADPGFEPRYGDLFHRFLAAGFLAPPDPRLPLILPATLSAGEDEALSRILQTEP